MRHTRQQWLSS
ncbi:hypothetical protein VCCP1040_0008, partial [Vibrio cholerae CP1040(13)]